MTREGNPWWTPWRVVDDVTVLHVDLMPNTEREAHALSLLDETETGRYHRFLSVRAKREFALCRGALRLSLAERLGCDCRQIAFACLEHGKPYAIVAGQTVDTAFNVSHSGLHGLIAITDRDCVGVDIEERAARRDLDGIGSFVYGQEELRLLRAAPDREKAQIFYRLWSMKEALIKALGTGFSLSPSEFEIPEPVLLGAPSCVFRFPHLPSESWRLLDMGERRFAAALAYRLSPPEPAQKPAAGR